MIPTVHNTHHLGLNVADLDAAVHFFVSVLGAQEVFRFGPFSDPTGDSVQRTLGVHPRARLVGAMLRFGPNFNLELLKYHAPDQAA